MAAFLYQWVLNIAAVGVLSSLFELLLPSGNIKKFGQVVLGLVMVLALLKPLANLLGNLA